MIDKAILDEVLPVPELETLKEEKIAELKEEGFAITNFHSGGVFYTLLLIVLRIKIEFTELLRAILNNMTLTHSTGAWLDIKAADYGKKRKKAQKTQGLVTLSRTNDQGEAVKIEKGHIFKTQKDINGEELRFFAIEAAVLQKGSRSVDVLVEAEKEGSRYNVPEGQITRSLTFLNGIDGISNGEDWIVREGSDTEDDEGLRTRALRSWSELAARSIEDTFINAAEAVQGVLFAQADCDHPRGQGTVDVIVTGTAGEATEGLLDEVREAVDKIAGPYDNILVKSSETVPQDIAVTVSTSDVSSEEEIKERIRSYQATLGQEETIELSRENWLVLANGDHQLRVEAVDGNFATSVRVWNFSKKETVIAFQFAQPEETDARATKILITPTWHIEGSVAKVEACNNAFDASPAWEDITAQVAINRVYNFLNQSKTAEKWGVNVRFTIEKNEGYEGEVSISGFGGAYE